MVAQQYETYYNGATPKNNFFFLSGRFELRVHFQKCTTDLFVWGFCSRLTLVVRIIKQNHFSVILPNRCNNGSEQPWQHTANYASFSALAKRLLCSRWINNGLCLLCSANTWDSLRPTENTALRLKRRSCAHTGANVFPRIIPQWKTFPYDPARADIVNRQPVWEAGARDRTGVAGLVPKCQTPWLVPRPLGLIRHWSIHLSNDIPHNYIHVNRFSL